MAIDQRQPYFGSECFILLLLLPALIILEQQPTPVPVYQSQVYFDVAVPVDSFQVRILFLPAGHNAHEEIEIFRIAGSLVVQQKWKEELQPVHLPNHLRASISVGANIDRLRERHRESLTRRDVEMEVHRVVDGDRRTEDRELPVEFRIREVEQQAMRVYGHMAI